MTAGRRLVLLGAAGSLAGCGFHPLYGPMANGRTVSPMLASVYVDVIGERPGQLLRQALQARLEGTDSGVAKRFELVVPGVSINAEAIGIQSDTSSTRTRISASSSWNLRRFDAQHTGVTSGNARASDGIDINDQQYFAADLEQSTVVRRLTEALADDIVLDIAAYFRAHPDIA